MALDVYLQENATIPCLGDDGEVVAQFEDDGYYWFLWPLFEDLRRATGQSIDLYGDAIFSSDNLGHLKSTIEKAQQLVEAQNRTWDVFIGTQAFPQQKEVYATVEKQRFKSMLEELRTAIAKAQRRGWCIAFWGD